MQEFEVLPFKILQTKTFKDQFFIYHVLNGKGQAGICAALYILPFQVDQENFRIEDD